MVEIVGRLGLLLLVGLGVLLLVWLGRRFVEAQRRQALAAPSPIFPVPADSSTSVRILAFSSDDCQQCHRLQAPALQRVLAARGDSVSVVEVDATSEQELAHTYRILTVPSTVVLDSTGNAHAINYGFANTQRLLAQIDEVLSGVEGVEVH